MQPFINIRAKEVINVINEYDLDKVELLPWDISDSKHIIEMLKAIKNNPEIISGITLNLSQFKVFQKLFYKQ